MEAGGGEWCSTADEACGGAILQPTPAEQVLQRFIITKNKYIKKHCCIVDKITVKVVWLCCYWYIIMSS